MGLLNKFGNIYRLKGIRGANVYLLDTSGEMTLIDTGLKGQADKILSKIQDLGFDSGQLKNIIITHAHSDHTGSAKALAKKTSARVLAHQQEIPFLEKTKSLPTASGLASLFSRLEKWIMPAVPAFSVHKGLEDGEILDILGVLQVIHTPGHTPGAISLYQPEQKILFCGDTLFNQNPATGRKGLRLPIKAFTSDRETARKSVEKLTEFSIETIFFGHGEPIRKKATERLKELLARRGQ